MASLAAVEAASADDLEQRFRAEYPAAAAELKRMMLRVECQVEWQFGNRIDRYKIYTALSKNLSFQATILSTRSNSWRIIGGIGSRP
jgi:hypothetical protein